MAAEQAERQQPFFEIRTDDQRAMLQGRLALVSSEPPDEWWPPEKQAAYFRLTSYLEHLLQGGRVGVWDYARETGGWKAGDGLSFEQHVHNQMIGLASCLIDAWLNGRWLDWRPVDALAFVCFGELP